MVAKFVFAGLAVVAGLGSAMAEPAACQAHFNAVSGTGHEFPGALAARRDTPCILSFYIGHYGKGGHVVATQVTSAPANGSVQVRGATSLILTPNKGFVGSDAMTARLTWGNGATASVRFAIDVR